MYEQRLQLQQVGLAVGIVAILILLTACSATGGVATIDGADGATSTPSPSAGPEDPEEALFAFAECMREQGIDMPDMGTGGAVRIGPGEEGPSFDPFSDEFEAAREECEVHLEGVEDLGPRTQVNTP